MAEFTKIGAGWKNKSGKGYSCKLEEPLSKGERFFIFSNKHKTEDKHPDIILGYFNDSENEQKQEIPDEGIPF